ncbi:hypothetical protein SP15_002 [Bacillus phage SP-15]|uniref:DUF1273 family protein n=1 Tax=Bacillus phage SP-15 TaxID=1792032 RepID=A0A127AVV6_9CAUD|nr:GTP-binding domain [Bacillus phage SP-15]AMM44800.1 hypothetical protein SP15_002 [Bacillus phage SP-15]
MNQQTQDFLLAKHTASFTGHRPNKLGGYDMNNPINVRARMEIFRLVQWLVEVKNVYRFYTGGALGWDQLAFWAIEKVRRIHPHIENMLAIPYRDQPNIWRDKSAVETYYKMIETATKVFYVDEEPHYGVKNSEHGRYDIRKLQRRNDFMVDKGKYLIAGYDGSKGGTQNCFNYARMRRRIIYQINPKENFNLKVWDYAE